jgi:hypothetical protein
MTEGLRAILELVARQPHLPRTYMALLVGQDHDTLAARLAEGTAAGLLAERGSCCGQETTFAITPAGMRAL